MLVSDLKPNPNNPRTISDNKLAMLKKSLAEFGDLGGFVFNRKTKQLVGGHQRAKIFDKNTKIVITKKYDVATKAGTLAEGYVEIKGERFRYREVSWDKFKEKAANIAANKGAGEWDFPGLSKWMKEIEDFGIDLDLTMFDDEERGSLLAVEKVEGKCDEDEVPQLPKKAKTRLGDIYTLGNHRLLCGDSTNIQHVELLMDGHRADMVFTDPPYNIASDSKNFAKNVSKAMKDLSNSDWDKNFEIEPALNTVMAVCANSCTIYVWTSHFLFHKILAQLKSWCDFTGYCVWSKPNPMPSLAKRHWTWSTELCVYATRGTKRIVNFPEEGHASNVWEITKKSDGTHPTQKPIELCTHPIEFSSNPGQIILDLFGGSGSTLIACEKTNRKCFMMELDPHYCDVIVARWEKYTGKKARLIAK